MTLFQWMADGNVNWGECYVEVYSTFFKILPPNHVFTIVISSPIYSDIKDQIRIIPNEEIKKFFSPLSNIRPGDKPSYQSHVLILSRD